MTKTKPVVTVTHRLTSRVEERLSALFTIRPNTEDRLLSADELATAMQASDALLCTVTDVLTADILKVKNRRASMIANFGVGYSNIDIETARGEGIIVSNTPDVLTDATADIAMLLILASTRRAYRAESLLRAGRWSGFSIARDLGVSIQNKTLGIVGMGRIGRAVARRAVLGFGMKIVYYNRSEVEGLDFPAISCDSIASVMQGSDVISLHIPGAVGEGPVITGEMIAKMKSTSFLINTARGDLVDEQALIQALESGQIAGAGLDVYADEPHVSKELKKMDMVTLLPHIGSATQEVRDAMGMMAIDNLVVHFNGGEYPSRVV